MVLLDRVISFEASKLITEVAIHSGIPFCEADGVPGWIGIEYMAQSVAAHAGAEARLLGDPPSVGFFLGTRSYKCSVNQFSLGETLIVCVEPLFLDSGLGAFSCCIETDYRIATATINVYQPDNESLESFWADETFR